MYSKEFNNCYILLSNISQALENTKFIPGEAQAGASGEQKEVSGERRTHQAHPPPLQSGRHD